MRYYKPADLRLHTNDKGELVIEQCGTVTETFTSEKKAIARFERIRAEFEKTLAPKLEVSDEERRELLQKYLADNSTSKKPPGSGRFG